MTRVADLPLKISWLTFFFRTLHYFARKSANRENLLLNLAICTLDWTDFSI